MYKQTVVNVVNNFPRSPALLPFVWQLVFEMPMVAARFREQWAIVRILKRERMDKRCERRVCVNMAVSQKSGWARFILGTWSIFGPWKTLRHFHILSYIYNICIYIYVIWRDLLYPMLITTQLILSLFFWKPTKKWKNISQRAHSWCHVQDLTRFRPIFRWQSNIKFLNLVLAKLGWCFFVPHVFPPKTLPGGHSNWRATILRRKLHAHVCLILVHTWPKTSLGTSPNHDCEFWLSWLMTLHVSIFLLSCLGSCLVRWMLYNFANLEIDPAFRKRKTASWLFWPT